MQTTIGPRVYLSSLTVEQAREQAGNLFAAHGEELEPDDVPAIDPDWDRYQALETAGNLISVGVWYHGSHPDNKPVLVGYAAAIIAPSLHYRGRVVCHDDLLYLQPHYRQGDIGVQLLKTIELNARVRGASILLMRGKTDSTMEHLLPRLGFRADETVFRKELI